MATTRWRITEWDHGPCPDKTFRKGGDLLILETGSDACTLVWMSGEDEPRLCWIDHLPLTPSEDPVPVYFPGQEKDCAVSLIRQGNGILGILTPKGDSNDGSGGTFAAEANGPGAR